MSKVFEEKKNTFFSYIITAILMFLCISVRVLQKDHFQLRKKVKTYLRPSVWVMIDSIAYSRINIERDSTQQVDYAHTRRSTRREKMV